MTEEKRVLRPETVTDSQGRVLHSIEKDGEPGFTMRSRSGGAIGRMICRMVVGGWIKEGPWCLTELGMAALKQYQHRVVERDARFMRRGGL